MHIETRTEKEKKKYYLSHSYRQKGKVKKLRIYLGANLPEAELEKKRKKAEKQITEQIKALKVIRDPYHTLLSPKELSRLKKLGASGAIKLSHLSEEDWVKFTEAFTYDTNAIEGSTVTEKEVANILEKDRWPQKAKGEISETYGVAKAVKYIRETKAHLSLDMIRELHRIVFENSKPFAGKFRGRGREVVIADRFGNIVHRGAPASQVVSLLKELTEWYEENKKFYPPLVLAAVVHNQFENIHPFEDGNGRVGRLLINNILLKHGLPPVNIELENRREYYDSLQAYHTNHDIRPTIELMLREYKKLRKALKKTG
jgi:Fic family protein